MPGPFTGGSSPSSLDGRTDEWAHAHPFIRHPPNTYNIYNITQTFGPSLCGGPTARPSLMITRSNCLSGAVLLGVDRHLWKMMGRME